MFTVLFCVWLLCSWFECARLRFGVGGVFGLTLYALLTHIGLEVCLCFCVCLLVFVVCLICVGFGACLF